MLSELSGAFISWLPFQRRSKTLSEALNLELKYFHYNWEEKHKLLKCFSYILKFFQTLVYLFAKQPQLVFVQLAPTPPLYAVALYAILTKAPYISDCHNTMIYDGHWIHWPLAKYLLKRSDLVLVHNEEVKQKATYIGIKSFIYMDPPPVIHINEDITIVSGIKIKEENYILLPCNMGAVDEPAEEFFKAAQELPNIQFILTGYAEKIPTHLRQMAPSNVIYTGYLKEDEFNALYKYADASLVLSTREGTQPSGASEAITLGVPLIVTNSETTRNLYKGTVIFVENVAREIVKGVNEASHNKHVYKQHIYETKKMIASKTNAQYENLLVFISSLYERKKQAKQVVSDRL